MPDKLASYRKKRNFKRTAEPSGAEVKGTGEYRYVMHKHAASHDHFDLRLEYDGVFRSWAVPKGPSLKPGEKKLAIEVEDHPLDYGDFEGVIPQKEYGGGTVMLWDRGSWQPREKPRADRLDFELQGEKLSGHWTLVRIRDKKKTGGNSKKQWLLIKRSDDHQVPDSAVPSASDQSVKTGRTMDQIAEGASPKFSEPEFAAAVTHSRPDQLPGQPPVQLATPRDAPPEGDQWLHELKFDGYRLLARLSNGKVTLLTRNTKDWTCRFPEIRDALQALPAKNALIDGEVVVPQPDGSTSFRKLQEYLGRKKIPRGQIAYQIFDLLFLNDHSLLKTPLLERKNALLKLLRSVDGTLIRYSDHVQGQGAEFFKEVCELGLEGMVSKQIEAGYRDGRQSSWIKTKCTHQDEFVVGGFTPGSGKRQGFGSLLLGTYDRGRLVYAGRVGSGFSTRQLTALFKSLKNIEIESQPFAERPPEADDARWVRPEMVVDVEFTDKTASGVLRHPVFRGLREDKSAREVKMSQDSGKPGKSSGNTVANVAITHPDRPLYPEQGITKADVARHYEALAPWILPQLNERPLSLLRCPEGLKGECFFQKHPDINFAKEVPRVAIPEKQGGTSDYVYIGSATDLVWLVQFGVLEFHPWGCRIDDLERPDTLVFDLDPGPGLPWRVIAMTAKSLRERLATLGLNSFLQATGGKGLHLIVPVKPELDWEQAKAFAQAISRAHASDDPGNLTTNMSKTKRKGKVFIDYLRNSRGSTSIARYSTRANEGATVATPLRWDELSANATANRYTINNVRRRLSALKADPWESYEEARRPITRKMLKQLKLE